MILELCIPIAVLEMRIKCTLALALVSARETNPFYTKILIRLYF